MDGVRMVVVVRAGAAMTTVVSDVQVAAMVAIVGSSTCLLDYSGCSLMCSRSCGGEARLVTRQVIGGPFSDLLRPQRCIFLLRISPSELEMHHRAMHVANCLAWIFMSFLTAFAVWALSLAQGEPEK